MRARRPRDQDASGTSRFRLAGHLGATQPAVARSERLTPPELAVKVCGVLRAAGIEHAVGGALALGFYAEPRGTYDLDLNIFVAAEAAEAALDVLRRGGIEIGEDAALVVAERGDLFVAHGGCRLDLFFNSIPLHLRAAGRTRTVRLLETRIPILSPEDLIVLKLSRGVRNWGGGEARKGVLQSGMT